MREHQGLGDKNCPKCEAENSVHWKSSGVSQRGHKTVEWGYYYCEYCDWHSEFHEIEIEPNA